MSFPGRFGPQRDQYAEGLRERLLLECEALLSDDAERYSTALSELDRTLTQLLAPQSLHPADSGNVLLQLERAYQDGVAELEQAGHRTEGLSVHEYLHRLSFLEKKRPVSNT